MGRMTQEERWITNYEEVMLFIKENGRNLSKYNLEERRLYTWVKHQRKVMNKGEMRPERVSLFRELMEMMGQYRWKNQYE